MSLVSNGSLNENTTPYIGIFSRSGLRPNALSSSAARSSASGCWRKNSQTGGAPGGSGPSDGCLSNSPQQVTERSPRMLSVPMRVELAGVRDADDHAELLRHVGLGGGRLHAAEFERRAFVLVEIGQDGRRLHGLRRELQRRAGAHHAGRFGNRRAVLRHQHAGDAVVGAHAGEIVLHHRDHGGPARPDRRVQVVDRRLFETKRLRPGHRLVHCLCRTCRCSSHRHVRHHQPGMPATRAHAAHHRRWLSSVRTNNAIVRWPGRAINRGLR